MSLPFALLPFSPTSHDHLRGLSALHDALLDPTFIPRIHNVYTAPDHFILVLDQGRTLVAIDSVPSGPSRLHSSQHPALLKDLLQPTNTDGDKVTTGSVPDVLLLRLPWPLQAIQLATLPDAPNHLALFLEFSVLVYQWNPQKCRWFQLALSTMALVLPHGQRIQGGHWARSRHHGRERIILLLAHRESGAKKLSVSAANVLVTTTERPPSTSYSLEPLQAVDEPLEFTVNQRPLLAASKAGFWLLPSLPLRSEDLKAKLIYHFSASTLEISSCEIADDVTEIAVHPLTFELVLLTSRGRVFVAASNHSKNAIEVVELSSLAPFDSQTAHSLVLLHSLLLLFEECFVKVYEIDSGLLLGDVALPSAPLIVPRPLLPSTVSSTWTAFTGFLTQLGLTEIRPPQITTIAEHLANAGHEHLLVVADLCGVWNLKELQAKYLLRFLSEHPLLSESDEEMLGIVHGPNEERRSLLQRAKMEEIVHLLDVAREAATLLQNPAPVIAALAHFPPAQNFLLEETAKFLAKFSGHDGEQHDLLTESGEIRELSDLQKGNQMEEAFQTYTALNVQVAPHLASYLNELTSPSTHEVVYAMKDKVRTLTAEQLLAMNPSLAEALCATYHAELFPKLFQLIGLSQSNLSLTSDILAEASIPIPVPLNAAIYAPAWITTPGESTLASCGLFELVVRLLFRYKPLALPSFVAVVAASFADSHDPQEVAKSNFYMRALRGLPLPLSDNDKELSEHRKSVIVLYDRAKDAIRALSETLKGGDEAFDLAVRYCRSRSEPLTGEFARLLLAHVVHNSPSDVSKYALIWPFLPPATTARDLCAFFIENLPTLQNDEEVANTASGEGEATISVPHSLIDVEYLKKEMMEKTAATSIAKANVIAMSASQGDVPMKALKAQLLALILDPLR